MAEKRWKETKCVGCGRSVRVTYGQPGGCHLCGNSSREATIEEVDDLLDTILDGVTSVESVPIVFTPLSCLSSRLEDVDGGTNPTGIFDDRWSRGVDLRGLEGTYKQVQWALKIRRGVLSRLVQELLERSKTSDAKVLGIYIKNLILEEDAWWWIEHRGDDFLSSLVWVLETKEEVSLASGE